MIKLGLSILWSVTVVKFSVPFYQSLSTDGGPPSSKSGLLTPLKVSIIVGPPRIRGQTFHIGTVVVDLDIGSPTGLQLILNVVIRVRKRLLRTFLLLTYRTSQRSGY